MIGVWGLIHNALWVVGLAAVLAALSVACYQAALESTPLRTMLSKPGIRVLLQSSLAVSCLGILFSGQAWWARAAWGLLCIRAAAQAGRSLRQYREKRPATAVPTLRDPGRAKRVGRGLLLAGILATGGWAAFFSVQLLAHGRSLQAHMRALEEIAGQAGQAGESGLPEAAGAHLAGMHEDLDALQGPMGPLLPLGRLMRWVPRYGGDLEAASDLMVIALRASSAADRAFQALSPALDLFAESPGGAGPAEPLGEGLLSVLVVAQPWLGESQQDLRAVRLARDRIEAGRLSPRLAGWLARLDRYLPWFDGALRWALLSPGLLGASGPRKYLVVAQNSDELRPTGGFISGVGEMTIEEGRITSLMFQDSYAVDNLQVPHDVPPLDFQRTLYGQLWFFRDANWDADFPTSARRALEIYARDRGILADGVIALDLAALQLLVGAVEPLQVEGIDDGVTGGNVLQIIRQQWSASQGKLGSDWWLHRKDVMGQIAGAAMERLTGGQGVDPARLALALKKALDEKHILVYLTDAGAAATLRDLDWDGGLPDPFSQSDLLLIVDSNVGFNKVDANVERSIRYEVDLGGEQGPQARLTVTYRNHSQRTVDACVQEARYGDTYDDMMDRCYWDYSRVYVPAGSELSGGPNIPLPGGSMLARSGASPAQETVTPTLNSKSGPVWTAFFDLAPGEERTLEYVYQLPRWLLETQADGTVRYRLRVQKQPGTDAVPLRVEVLLPPGAVVAASTPTDLGTQQGVSTDLHMDQEFEIVYRDGALP